MELGSTSFVACRRLPFVRAREAVDNADRLVAGEEHELVDIHLRGEGTGTQAGTTSARPSGPIEIPDGLSRSLRDRSRHAPFA
jgi:hypothetical protein